MTKDDLWVSIRRPVMIGVMTTVISAGVLSLMGAWLNTKVDKVDYQDHLLKEALQNVRDSAMMADIMRIAVDIKCDPTMKPKSHDKDCR